MLKHRWKINGKSKKNQWTNRWKIDKNSMKNRPKSSLEACWALLGPLGVPYWRPWASWEHLGSVLRASWSVLGASRWHPGARRGPHMDPRKGKHLPKIDIKSRKFFDRFLDSILIPKWSQNDSPNPPRAVQKGVSFFDRFFHRFLDRSWEPKSLKMSTSCARESHFHKIACSDSDIILEARVMKTSSKHGANMA